jgi:hypothetical protein
MTNAAAAPLSAALLLAALPVALRPVFLPLQRWGVWTLEHNDGYASTNHRAEQLHDGERALEGAGLDAYRVGSRIEVLGWLDPEACVECKAPSPALCRCCVDLRKAA